MRCISIAFAAVILSVACLTSCIFSSDLKTVTITFEVTSNLPELDIKVFNSQGALHDYGVVPVPWAESFRYHVGDRAHCLAGFDSVGHIAIRARVGGVVVDSSIGDETASNSLFLLIESDML
jgi:hypothetical protein